MKKVLIIFTVMAILALSIPSSVVLADPAKKPVTPGDLKNVTFIHYVKPDSPPGKPDKTDDTELPEPDNSAYTLIGSELTDTVTYYVNTGGAPDGALDEILEAFGAWDTVTADNLFAYGGETDVSRPGLDGQNTVSWLKIAPRKTIAVTSLWYIESTGEVVEFDITFNAFLEWGIDPDDEGEATLTDMFDVENIGIHEVGHVVGLGDLYEDQYRELTMYGYGRTGETIKISLEAGDIAGAQYLYGTPGE